MEEIVSLDYNCNDDTDIKEAYGVNGNGLWKRGG